jgi:acetyl esterase/lipase
MVSLAGRFFNWYFTRIGFKNGMAKDIRHGNDRAAVPTSKIMAQNAVDKEIFNGRNIWTLHPKGKKQTTPKVVILFYHGGAYFYDILKEHYPPWARIANISGAAVVLPSYPLTPKASALEITDWALACYHHIKAKYPNSKIIIGGDSAGGGLALQVCQRIAQSKAAPADHLLLWSPWADVSRDNPALEAQDKHSVIIGLKGSQAASDLYRGDLDPRDPRISPIYADLSGLPPITIVTGSRDLLHPDILRLADALRAAGAIHDIHIWPEQNHYFMYLPQPEAKAVAKQTARLVEHLRAN